MVERRGREGRAGMRGCGVEQRRRDEGARETGNRQRQYRGETEKTRESHNPYQRIGSRIGVLDHLPVQIKAIVQISPVENFWTPLQNSPHGTHGSVLTSAGVFTPACVCSRRRLRVHKHVMCVSVGWQHCGGRVGQQRGQGAKGPGGQQRGQGARGPGGQVLWCSRQRDGL